MKYLALLRGINVGRNSIVSMAELKAAFESAGFTQISTYINSGNVLFASEEHERSKLTYKIDTFLQKRFFAIKTVVVSHDKLKQVVKHAPKSWVKEDLRKYVSFMIPPARPEELIQEAQLKEGIDFIEKGPAVAYMSTKLSGLTKSGYPKLASKPVYQNMTIRSYNTVQKLLRLMEK